MLEKLKGTIDKGVAAVSVKSEVLVETSRVKTAINNAQRKMDGEITDLGAKVYGAWKTGEASIGAFAQSLQSIQAIEEEIAGLNVRLEEIKQEESRILGTQAKPAAAGCFCTNCGKSLPAGSRFCDECGTPVAQK